MEEVHATHKDAAWGWFAVLLGLLDGFPRRRARRAARPDRPSTVVTPWSQRAPGGWSA